MRIGTRGSALALAQAEWVRERLRAAGIEGELVTITTPGDRGEAVSDKSRWVSALEQALLDGSIDAAVHSAKDVPGELAPGTVIAAVPPREDPHDALCGAGSLIGLPAGARVGTSSLRRAAQLRALRDDLEVVELRGNVDTRLRKLADGEVDAAVLAVAGLRRLGREAAVGAVLGELIPAAGQGALLIQTRTDGAVDDWRSLDDREAGACLRAERELMARLGASCHTAAGAHATVIAGGEALELRAWVGLPDGSRWIADALEGPVGTVAAELADRLEAVGARELLQRAEAEARA